ncbi:MAG TPA: glyoxalase superfamily protein [Bryobacteraceae bacterium]|nr:glyoxalase superfamily protein [Bryobacteraceae bacterium]
MPLNATQVIPVLRIFSVEKAKEFYLGFLGFQVDWEHRFEENMPVYMQISLGTLRLHLSEHHGDACPGSAVLVYVTGLAEYHQEIMQKGYKYLRPGLKEEWNGMTLHLTDPFGNRLHFTERREGR